MNLYEKFSSYASFCGCESELSDYARSADVLSNSRLKNIAVIGETNCGKTTLINLLCGTQIRKPTKISLGEVPLMVTFGSEESRDGFEKADIQAIKEEQKDLAFYEIPLNMAIDLDSKKVSSTMEMIDAVIYIISAVMPFTDADLKNLSVLVERFPLILWISKTDIFDNDQDYEDCLEYVKNNFSGHFPGAICEFFDGKMEDAPDKLLMILHDLSIDEVREYHISQIEQLTRDMISERLNMMLTQIRKEKAKQEELMQTNDLQYRRQQSEWNQLRVTMMEKQQETMDAADRLIAKAKMSAKKQAAAYLKDSSVKREWLSNELKPYLEAVLNDTAQDVFNEITERSAAHAAWLISEVNRRFGRIISVNEMNGSGVSVAGHVGKCDIQMDYRKIGVAAGAGIVAGGAAIGSLVFMPSVIIAIPASIISVAMIKGSIDDYSRYTGKLLKFVEECCERNFNSLLRKVRRYIQQYYDKLIGDIERLSNGPRPSVDFSNISENENKIKQMLRMVEEA